MYEIASLNLHDRCHSSAVILRYLGTRLRVLQGSRLWCDDGLDPSEYLRMTVRRDETRNCVNDADAHEPTHSLRHSCFVIDSDFWFRHSDFATGVPSRPTFALSRPSRSPFVSSLLTTDYWLLTTLPDFHPNN
jgi:hypothetical protein